MHTLPLIFFSALCINNTHLPLLHPSGYGYHSPATTAGRVVCMIYAVIGIPLTGILLAWTSDFFGEQLFKLFKAKVSIGCARIWKETCMETCYFFLIFMFPGQTHYLGWFKCHFSVTSIFLQLIYTASVPVVCCQFIFIHFSVEIHGNVSLVIRMFFVV